MKLILFLICQILLCLVTFGQINTKVKLSIKLNSKDYKKISIVKMGMKSHLNYVPDIDFNIENGKQLDTIINLNGIGFYEIADGYKGHMIFLNSGDTVSLTLNPIPDIKKRMDNGEIFMKFLKMRVKSKYPGNLTFYDNFEEQVGYAIKYKIGEDPIHFTKRCDSAFNLGKKQLSEYIKLKLVSTDFENYAIAQMQSWYVMCFSEMLYFLPKNKVPASCLNFVKTLSFDDSTLAVSTRDYMSAASVYNMYIQCTFNLGVNGDGYSNLSNEFSSILKNHKGVIKDQLLAWSMIDYANKYYPNYDSFYNIFLTQCQTEIIKEKTIKKVNQKRLLKQEKSNNDDIKVLFQKTYIDNVDNKESTFNSLLSDSLPSVIDCWATWCSPCKEQIPSIHEMELKYKDKINFIYLSFDIDELKWRNFIKVNKFHKLNHFLIANQFQSSFSKYFNIESIPRYILLSPGGTKVLNYNMPLPAQKDQFELELNKYIH